jgi:hypothetical protein
MSSGRRKGRPSPVNGKRVIAPLQFRPTPGTRELIDRYAKFHGITTARACEDLLRLAERNMLLDMLAKQGVAGEILLRAFSSFPERRPSEEA